MANVKITDLTELAATDLATNDVLPIVDINNDSTKKVTIASLTGLSDANDFVTYTQLNANLDIVQDNVAAEATAIQSRLTTNVAITTAVEARRVANIAGAVSTITTGDLTASRALASDSSGKVAVSAVTSTELGHLDGVSSAIQTQINDINTRATANATSSGAADAVEARRVANIAGAVSTITTGDLTASRALASDGSGKVAVSAVTATELGYLDGVSSAIQTQINSKQATITGAATTIDDADLTASRAVVSDGSGKVAVSAVTATEVGYLDGVSSAIQTQLDAKAALAGATFTGDVTLTNTDGGSSASPIIVLDRQSASPADADYLGRIQFKGKDDGAGNDTYAQISGKIIDASAGSEDGAIEVSIKKAGSSTIVSRQKSDKLQLLNGTQLSVDGTSEFTGEVTMTDDLVVTGNLTVNGATTTVSTTNLDVEDRMIMLADGVSGSPSADVGLLFNRGNQGNAAIFYDESAKTFKLSDTKDPKSNTSLSPVTASNLSVGIVDAATLKYDGLSVHTSIADNASVAAAASAAVEARRVANIAGAVSSITTGNLTASRALASDGSGKVAVSAVTSTELGYLDGVSSAIQTQIDSKQATITGAATTIDDADLTASRALASDGSGKVAVSAVTATELGYLDGVSSAIQTQLDAKGTTTEDTALQARITANATITTAVEARRVANIAGAVSTITTGDLTASRALASDGSGKVAVSAVTATELGYLDGVSSAIQTQIDSKQATITGAATTIDDADLTASRAIVSDGSGKVAVSAVTATEIGYLDGVSSAIQTQIAALETRRTNNIAGAVSTVTTSDLTADRVMITNGSGKIAASSGVTPTELGYLDGLTLGTVAASKAVTADSNGDVNFIREVDIDGNVVIGTNASNTVTIVGVLDCGAFS